MRPGHRITGDRQRDHTRGAGWEFLHIAIDDHSRFAFAQLLRDETARSTIAFLHAALAFFKAHGIDAQRIYSDTRGIRLKNSHAAHCSPGEGKMASREHPSAGGGEIALADLGEADQLIAIGVTGVASEEECDIRVCRTSGANGTELSAKFLWMRKAHDSRRSVMREAHLHGDPPSPSQTRKK